jgi:hypothetical protein
LKKSRPARDFSYDDAVDGDRAFMYTLHCTQKLLARVKQQVLPLVPEPTTGLGNWYATALLWKPQLALFVNETTRLPVLMPLAPASTVAARFPQHLAEVLSAHAVDPAFIAREVIAMAEVGFAKTASRSLLGSMNDFAWLAEGANTNSARVDSHGISMYLAKTPIGPMGYNSPAYMLMQVVEAWAHSRARMQT